ncbi:PRC-barrel domain containing protein [Halosimplex aquaticum]|uniref:PRC-barrel domain containing protein n=1 Tax=Halosimplex aquaticum TaxID=3026162 RepID=A0ABD5Y6D9_9EURY
MSDRTTVSDDDQETHRRRERREDRRRLRGPRRDRLRRPRPRDHRHGLLEAGWSDADEDDYPLPADEIAVITDDEIRLT